VSGASDSLVEPFPISFEEKTMLDVCRVSRPRGPLAAVVAVVGAVACQNGPIGGPVSGAVDNHCFIAPDGGSPGGPLQAQTVSQASCTNAGDGGAPSGPEYGSTMNNSASNDDDCKYQVGWWSSAIQQNTDVTFYVSVLYAADGTPLTGAAANNIIEAFLSDTHPAPNTNQSAQEVSPGVYAIGPIRFDQAGQWTVRFHFNENCFDILPDSPHGHAAFYVKVP
jgi:hypothetical protein